MGINYSADLKVGFIFTYEAFWEPFIKEIAPTTYKLEDRFDPKTGKKTTPVEVLDSCGKQEFRIGEEVLFRIGDEEASEYFDAEERMQQELGKRLEAEVYRPFGEDLIYVTVRSEEAPCVGEGVDCGRGSFGGHLSYDAVLKAAPTVERIRKELIALGLVPDPPLIIHNVEIG